MFLCSLIEELCTKEENDKTGCNYNFGHKCISLMYVNSLGLPKNTIYNKTYVRSLVFKDSMYFTGLYV